MINIFNIFLVLISGLIWFVLSKKRASNLVRKIPINKPRATLAVFILSAFILMFLPFSPSSSDSEVQNRNLDVYIILDTSLSMNAGDSANNKTRLETVKDVLGSSLSELSGSRFTFISFHSRAYVEVPGMYDLSALQDIISTTESPLFSRVTGTAFSPALELAYERIERAKSNEKTKDMQRALIVISDGERIGEEENTDIQLEKIADSIDKALILGVGTEEGGTMNALWTRNGGPNYDQPEKRYIIDPSYPQNSDAPRNEDGLVLAISKADTIYLEQTAQKLNGKFVSLEKSDDISKEIEYMKDGSKLLNSGRTQFLQTSPNGYYWIIAPISILLVWMMYLRIKIPGYNSNKAKK